MNMHTTGVLAPPSPRGLEAMALPLPMMRDILIKTMFRQNISQVTQVARAICLPINVTQELVDIARTQLLLEATGTMSANAGNEMGYQLTDAGRTRANEALKQSEYFGPMPVPLAVSSSSVQMCERAVRRVCGTVRSALVIVLVILILISAVLICVSLILVSKDAGLLLILFS